jgi:nucleotide-binding universal stress UspA family protein
MATSAYRSMLVPLDGSASAYGALGLALRLVGPGGEVLLAHAINRCAVVAECVTPYGGDPTPALDALEADEADIFARATAQARDAGVRCSTVALDGRAGSCIIALAREKKVDAIAMGTHGRRGLARVVLGNTAAGVLHDVELPTFVVHEQNAATAVAPFREILVAFDSSPAARDAARAAVDLAAHDRGSIFLAHVAERDDDDAQRRAFADAAAYALSAGVAGDCAVLHGDALDAILIGAEARHADLIAVGAHGHGIGPFLIGSLAEAVARTSPVPVLIVPASARAGAKGSARTAAARATA